MFRTAWLNENRSSASPSPLACELLAGDVLEQQGSNYSVKHPELSFEVQRWWYLREECGNQSTAQREGVPCLGWKRPHTLILGGRGRRVWPSVLDPGQGEVAGSLPGG